MNMQTTNHMSKISWKLYSGRKALVSVGVLGAVGVILIVKLKKLVDLGLLDQNLHPPRFWAVPGLTNHGNNCFLNVVLQALASGSGLRKYLCEMVDEYGLSSIDEIDDNLPLISSLTSMVEELCTVRHRRTVLSPRNVMLAMDLYIPNFNLTRQQDAEEAFSLLLSSLREEIADHFVLDGCHLADLLSSSHSRFIIPKSSGEESEAQRWRRSYLGPFDGVLGSSLLCERCSFQISLDFQVFHTLHLSPPISSDGTIMAGCTLESCLKQFLMAEQINNYCCSNCWHNSAIEYLSTFSADKTEIDKLQNCSRNDDPCDCKSFSSLETFPWSNSYGRAFKQMSIAKCPKIFCIHLQRASYNMFGQSTKLQGHISFPCMLDLSSFMNTGIVTKASGSNLWLGRLERGSQDLTSFPHPNTQNMLLNAAAVPFRHKKYRLISAVEHFGSGGGGHYVVYRRVMAKISDEDPASILDSEMEQWFFISDSEVQSVSEEDVLCANATMLFYERIDEP